LEFSNSNIQSNPSPAGLPYKLSSGPINKGLELNPKLNFYYPSNPASKGRDWTDFLSYRPLQEKILKDLQKTLVFME
jgi:hypothetical protein